MKLNATQLGNVEAQLGVESVPEAHPVMPKLQEVFGDHTFFIDSNGLNTVESNLATDDTLAHVVKLASWSADQSQLEVHEPEVLSVAVDLDSDGTEEGV